MTRRSATNLLAARLRQLRPTVGVDNAGRRLWADMVNAVTGSGLIPETQVRDFRQIAGWESQFDRALLESKV